MFNTFKKEIGFLIFIICCPPLVMAQVNMKHIVDCLGLEFEQIQQTLQNEGFQMNSENCKLLKIDNDSSYNCFGLKLYESDVLVSFAFIKSSICNSIVITFLNEEAPPTIFEKGTVQVFGEHKWLLKNGTNNYKHPVVVEETNTQHIYTTQKLYKNLNLD